MEQGASTSRIVRIAQFLYIWLCVGFPLGLITLTVGPMRWFASYAHKSSMSADNESLYGKLIIVGYVIVTIIIAVLIARSLLRSGSRKVKATAYGVLSLFLIVSVGIFVFNPKLLIASQKEEEVVVGNSKTAEGAKFFLGSYPDYNQLKVLKSEGYTAVISLLHSLVVPAEPKLLAEERDNAKIVGIQLIEIPMLPWVSGNDESVKKIRELAKSAKGKYYVHCYLGKDRVNAFRSILMDENANFQASKELVARSLSERASFEKGPVINLGNEIYLTPYPTDEEMLTYLFNGEVKTIISTLDPAVKSDRALVEREKSFASQYGVTFINIPVKSGSSNDLEALKDSVAKVAKPLVIHGFKSDNSAAKAIKELLQQ